MLLNVGMAGKNVVVDDDPAARNGGKESGFIPARCLDGDYEVVKGLPRPDFIEPCCLSKMSRTDYKNAAISQSIGSNDGHDGLPCTHLVSEQDSLGISGPAGGSMLQDVDYIFD